MSAFKGCVVSFRGKGSRDQTEYVFALALLHYALAFTSYRLFSKEFAGPQENP